MNGKGAPATRVTGAPLHGCEFVERYTWAPSIFVGVMVMRSPSWRQ
jgi:hypothetical protein